MPQQTATPKWAVQGPDGKVIQFPDEFTDVDVNREMGKLYPQGPPPNALQRYSEVTLGTQHPIDQFKSEVKNIGAKPKEFGKSLGETFGIPRDFWAHPADQFQNIGGTGIPGMIFGENGLIKDPLGFGERFTGAPQASEDVRSGNYKAIPGDVLGGLTNLALAKKPVEAGGTALADTARNAKAGIADIVRTPENKLTPTAAAVSRVGGAMAGHYLGIPGAGELAGVFGGPSLADAFLPKRPPTPNFFGGAYQPPEVYPGASLPSAEDFYLNRGADFMRRGAQEDILARRAAATAKANAPQPELGSPENPDFHSKLPTRMPKPAAPTPIKTSPFGNATPSNALNADIPIPQAGAYNPPSAAVPGVTANAYTPPEGIKGSIAKPSGRLILSPEEARAESAMQGIATRRASQHGMLYAAGMRPAGGGRVPLTPTATETVEYGGQKSAYEPPDAQYSRTGGAEGPYSPNYAYRAHTEGNFEINPESHAHATASPEEAETYAQHREGGENQVVSKIDIGKLQPHEYETFTGPNGKKWYRIKRQTSAGDYE